MQQLDKLMSSAVQAHFGPPKKTTIDKSVFLDGDAFTGGDINVPFVSAQIKRCVDDPDVVSVTVVLPPRLDFSQQRDLARIIVAAGASVVLRRQDESFDCFIAKQPKAFMPEHTDESAVLPPSLGVPNVKALEPFFYSPDERLALQKAYENDEDSSSIVS